MRPLTFIVFVIATVFLVLFQFLSRVYTEFPVFKVMGPAFFFAIVVSYILFDFKNVAKFFGRRGLRYGVGSGISLALGLLVIIGVVFLSTKPRFNKTIDVTSSGQNTLSSQSLNILSNIKNENLDVKIKGFFENDEVRTTFENIFRLYQAAYPPLRVEYIDPVKERALAEAEGLTSANTVIFTSGERTYRITTFNEEKITTALLNIVKASERHLYFVVGHGESSLDNYEAKGFSEAVALLEQNKLQVHSLNLMESGEVPQNANLIVIAGPKYEFAAQEIVLLENYLNKGGALLVMCDAVDPVKNINKMLEKYGMRFSHDYLLLRPDDPRVSILGQNIALVTEYDTTHPVTREFSRENAVAIPLANTRSLEIMKQSSGDFSVESLARTSRIIIRVKDVYSKDDLRNINPERLEEGDFNVVLIAQGKRSENVDGSQEKETRLMIVGSSQLASNYGAQTVQNLDLFINMVNFLMRDENYISIRPKNAAASHLDLSSNASQVSLQLLTYLYPFLILVFGLFVWLRRRRS